MLSAADAARTILAHVPRMPAETVQLRDALGAVLAADVVAPLDMLPWRSSAMDGYAVHGEDLEHLPVRLPVAAATAAGEAPAAPLPRGAAVRVATGAPVPDGADTVVRVEDTDGGRETVEIGTARDRGQHVRPVGEDYRRGETLVPRGAVVSPAAIGVLASAGVRHVRVHRRPTVSIVGSGDELVMLDELVPGTGRTRIVSSNSYSLPAQVRAMGAIARDMGVARDTPEALRERIESARGADLLVTTAGLSVGERDYTRRVLTALGADVEFSGVRIRPGAPMAFGLLDGVPWIGLSGNPVSAMVTFELYVRPALLRMAGHEAVYPCTVRVTLGEAVTTAAPLTHFLRAVVTPATSPEHATAYVARLTGTQSSAALTSMLRANALLIVPEDRQRYERGEILDAIPIAGTSFRSTEFPA